MSNENGNLKQIIYQESGNFVRQHESTLFQRLNYFLVAIAFLAAGFVELAATSTQRHANPLLMWLAILVGVTGFLISWFFTGINYFNGTTLLEVYEFAEKVEDDLFDDSSDLSKVKHLYWHINKEMLASGNYKFDVKTLLYDSIIASMRFKFNTKEGEPRAPHTWIIPFYFVGFWLVALAIYCSFMIHWWTFLLVIPILVVIVYHCIFGKHSSKEGKRGKTDVISGQ